MIELKHDAWINSITFSIYKSFTAEITDFERARDSCSPMGGEEKSEKEKPVGSWLNVLIRYISPRLRCTCHRRKRGPCAGRELFWHEAAREAWWPANTEIPHSIKAVHQASIMQKGRGVALPRDYRPVREYRFFPSTAARADRGRLLVQSN